MKSRIVPSYESVVELDASEFKTILNYLYDLQNIRFEQYQELSELTESLLKAYTGEDDPKEIGGDVNG